VEYDLQKQKPHNSLCGLGSWREQQQGDWSCQKTRLLYDKTTQKTMGFINNFIHLDATLDKNNYTQQCIKINDKETIQGVGIAFAIFLLEEESLPIEKQQL